MQRKLSICRCRVTRMQGKLTTRKYVIDPLKMWHSKNKLGKRVTNQNFICEEIKSRLNLSNVCYHSVQNVLSSRLLSINLKIKIYKIMILPVVLCGCEIWSRIWREEHRLKDMVLRRIFGPKRDEIKRGWRKLPNEKLHYLYSRQIQIESEWWYQGKWDSQWV
jgi:hypothetical protein